MVLAAVLPSTLRAAPKRAAGGKRFAARARTAMLARPRRVCVDRSGPDSAGAAPYALEQP